MNSVEGYLVTHPENATELGDHRFDDTLTDYSAKARVQELARAKQTRQQVEGLTDLSQLTGANNVDLRLLKDKVDNETFDIEELKEWEWNPWFTTKVSPTASICWWRAISRQPSSAFRICANVWKEFPPSSLKPRRT